MARAGRATLLIVGALAGGAIGVPLGAYLGRTAASDPLPAGRAGPLRNHYTPRIYTDPRFIDQLRPPVEALRARRGSG